MFFQPHPAAMVAVQIAATADRPVALVGILDALRAVPERVIQINILAAVAEVARPVPAYIVDRRIFQLEPALVRGHDQVSARRKDKGRFKLKYPSTNNVVGNWAGILSNSR